MIVGLTGGIACGKTTVSNLFRDKGCPIVDADQVAREVVEPGELGLSLVVERFGTSVLTVEGTLNRRKLGQIVFSNETARGDLNDILHPLIRKRMQEKKEEALKLNPPFVIMDIPLLYENQHENTVDIVIVVYVPAFVQLERLMIRDGFSMEEAKNRIASQMNIEEKKKRADFIIDNTGTFEYTKQQIEKIYSLLSKENGFDGNQHKS